MLLTICTIRQLPQALALGASINLSTTTGQSEPVLIGLVDDPTQLPTGFVSPYPLLPIGELIPAEQLAQLSAMYTPTEFAAACKPLFIAEAFRRYPDSTRLIYADPNCQFLSAPTPIWELLAKSTILLTPFITTNPTTGLQDKSWPDEKFFQNIGLFCSDFLALRRSVETDRLLTWWDNRVRERAYINFCEGLCLDQLWLMHVPVMFRDVAIVKKPGWHVALWNLSERTIQSQANTWQASGPKGQNEPLVFVNFKGLFNPDEGFFPHQNRVRLSDRPEMITLLNAYRQLVMTQALPVEAVSPAYGKQPEPLVIRGWRYATIKSMRLITRFLDRVYVPVIK